MSAELPRPQPPAVLPDLSASIEAEHLAAHRAARTALEHAVRCGALLLEAKASVGHGGWRDWVKAHLSFGERQERNYRRLAREVPKLREQIGNGVAVLSLRDAIGQLASHAQALRRLPEDTVAEVLADAEDDQLRHPLTRAQNQVRLRRSQQQLDPGLYSTIWIGGAPGRLLPPPDDSLLGAIERVIESFDLPQLVVLETLNELYCRIQNRHQLVTPAGFPDDTP
jgi:hypothetical protein